jgi:MarR family transcriptional regulator, lower aerobic nicotinate degradation pathway regulator
VPVADAGPRLSVSPRNRTAASRDLRLGMGPHPRLSRFTIWLAHELARRLRAEIDATLQAEYGLRCPDLLVLALVDGVPGISQDAVVDRSGIDRTTVSHLLRELEERGYLVRAPDPLDRRRARSTVTEVGSRVAAAGEAEADAATRRVLGRISARERRRLDQLLGRALGADAEVDAFGLLRPA